MAVAFGHWLFANYFAHSGSFLSPFWFLNQIVGTGEEPSLDMAVSATLGEVLLTAAWALVAEKAGLSSVSALSSSVTLGKCPDLSLASVFCSVKQG